MELISQSQAKVKVSKMLASLHDQSFAAFLRELIFDHAVIDWNVARLMLVHYRPDLRAKASCGICTLKPADERGLSEYVINRACEVHNHLPY